MPRIASTACCLVFGLASVGCPSAPQPAPPAPTTAAATTLTAVATASPATASATPAPSAAPVAKQEISAEEAERVLFLKDSPAEATACRERGSDGEQIHCLLGVLYGKDPQALEAVTTLYDEAGVVVGVEARHTMDGGWRGNIELVPEPPLGRHRRHVAWLVPAFRDYARFFAGLEERGQKKASFRYAPIRLRFFRSVGRTTPSAYASGWTVAYNVSGSLHTTPDAVRETMFHETFHLNDRAHGRWSEKALTRPFEAILARCSQGGKLSTPCLKPYAPNETMVRGGTYYAFQPGNGVWEYAAELAIRYYREHRRVLADQQLTAKAFKCGPAPNAETWQLLVDEFFGGIDLVPPC